jgi:4-diphosphocytidyl-2-C-methyl-D-erythritol kinase
MICFSNAKINLGLSVLGKRKDGFHNIESVLYPVPLFDVIECLPSKRFSIEVYGLEMDLSPEENLVYRAWKILHQYYQIPAVEVKLLKSIPMGSGLGGGSSNAATMLKVLNDLFKLGLCDDRLGELAHQLGSDCPFFILNRPAYVSGKGELLKPAESVLKDLYLVIVFPGIHVSSALAYRSLSHFHPAAKLSRILEQPMVNWRMGLMNDFEHNLFRHNPILKKTKEQLYGEGAIYASVTGSGSAIYGLYKNKKDFSSPLSFPYRWFRL